MGETNDATTLSWRDVLGATALATLWFAIVRPGGLDLPFFWDEADVYVPGSKWLAENGLNITPGVFPDDYSRGHPPLLYLVAGAAFATFGTTPAVAHLLMLPFGIVALVATYALGAQLFGRKAGAAAALVMAATPLFMSMGNMLLPEMPLTALAALSLLALSRGRLGLAAMAGCAAVLIKETGIFSAAAVGFALLYDAHRAGELRSRDTAKRIALCLLPLLALVAFFVWQRSTAGYYIFPHHQGLFTDRPLGFENLVTVVPSLFFWHGRWIITLGALVSFVVFRQRPATPAPGPRWRPRRRSVIVAIVALAAFNWIFFAKMFWLERYALPAHPGLVVLCCGLMLAASGVRYRLALLSVVACALWGLVALYGPAAGDSEEHTYAYADVVASHVDALSAIEGEDTFVVTTWPMSVELRFPYLGYVDAPRGSVELQYLQRSDHPRVSHVLINTASRRAEALEDLAASLGLQRVGEFQVGDAPRLELFSRPER